MDESGLFICFNHEFASVGIYHTTILHYSKSTDSMNISESVFSKAIFYFSLFSRCTNNYRIGFFLLKLSVMPRFSLYSIEHILYILNQEKERSRVHINLEITELNNKML